MRNYQSIKVHPEFAKMLKKRAAEEETSIIKLSEQISRNTKIGRYDEWKKKEKKKDLFPI